jgi:Mg-chelatase subunit ChlI
MIIWWIFDSAASGWNTVEREESLSDIRTFRISWIRKPEEGELRPQLLDRFWNACRNSDS